MPSFDVVNRLNYQEIDNAIGNATREIKNRYDFKGSDTSIVRKDNELRVDGKKKDDLQRVMQMIEDAKIRIPVQFVNFRD